MLTSRRTITTVIASIAVVFTTAWSSRGVDLTNVDRSSPRDPQADVDKKDAYASDRLGIEMPLLDQADIDTDINSDDAGYAEPTALSLRIAGIAERRGKIIVLVFDDARAFAAYDYTQAVGYAEVAASMGSIEVTVPVVGMGPYAVFLYHDANGDSRLNKKGGWPLEGFGYSGGADPYAAPSFEHAAIVSEEATIRVVYLPQRSR